MSLPAAFLRDVEHLIPAERRFDSIAIARAATRQRKRSCEDASANRASHRCLAFASGRPLVGRRRAGNLARVWPGPAGSWAAQRAAGPPSGQPEPAFFDQFHKGHAKS